MISIGILPSLQAKPFMLNRLMREHSLQRVKGKHVHLVSDSMVNPKAVTPHKEIVRRTCSWAPGGSAA